MRTEQERFDDILAEIVREEASTLLSIPGVYEVLAEHYNNEVLRRIAEESFEGVQWSQGDERQPSGGAG